MPKITANARASSNEARTRTPQVSPGSAKITARAAIWRTRSRARAHVRPSVQPPRATVREQQRGSREEQLGPYAAVGDRQEERTAREKNDEMQGDVPSDEPRRASGRTFRRGERAARRGRSR